ncbi:MAG: hypothetical protein AB7G48_01725 [Nitrospiraceae bacterium]
MASSFLGCRPERNGDTSQATTSLGAMPKVKINNGVRMPILGVGAKRNLKRNEG